MILLSRIKNNIPFPFTKEIMSGQKNSASSCLMIFCSLIKKDRYHFTGSVVFAPLKTEKKIEYYVVIDGQQRLTTIYILIKALIDCAETEREKDTLLYLVL